MHSSQISELANWERQIRNRSTTEAKMRFHENLLRRSRMSIQTPFEECSVCQLKESASSGRLGARRCLK